MQFSSSLKTQKKSSADSGSGSGSGLPTSEEAYRGQVLEKDEDDGADDLEDEADWHVGKLKFRKHIDDAYRAGQQLQDYTVIDPQCPSSSSSRASSSSRRGGGGGSRGGTGSSSSSASSSSASRRY